MKGKKWAVLGLALCVSLSCVSCAKVEEKVIYVPPATNGIPSFPNGIFGEGGLSASTPTTTGSVFYLNFKPEQASQWEEIAQAYTEERGVPVRVMTASAGEYEKMLQEEMAKETQPTLFQINGYPALGTWQEYCRDLGDSQLYSWLSDPSMAIQRGGEVYGIPYVVEGYGIIYNDRILQAYFALPQAKFTHIDQINHFSALESLVEDMSARKAELGIQGVFSSTSFSPGEDWRWQTHLMNLPVYYEYAQDGVSDKTQLDFRYQENYRGILDLYLAHSITEPSLLAGKTVEDSMKEFALGETAMVQNGNWGWGQISGVTGNVVTEEDVKFLPIYTGMPGEEQQSICIGTENFFCINKGASEEDQLATLDFLEWVFGSEEGKKMVTEKLGFISPFQTFRLDENPTDPLAQEVVRYMQNTSLQTVSWNFTTFPSQKFKDALGEQLFLYASQGASWDSVVDLVVTSWAEEKAP